MAMDSLLRFVSISNVWDQLQLNIYVGAKCIGNPYPTSVFNCVLCRRGKRRPGFKRRACGMARPDQPGHLQHIGRRGASDVRSCYQRQGSYAVSGEIAQPPQHQYVPTQARGAILD